MGMAEERCKVGDIELCFEQFGRREDPALLLVMGLGTQMLAWREDFCEQLAARGLRVIRFDNRDNGRSTILRHIPPPTIRQLITRDVAPGYTLEDMAADAVGLLDHLGVEARTWAGASMGGMIAQTMAIRHPDRVASLTSIMSTTGARDVGQPALGLYPVLLRRAPRERAAYVEFSVRTIAAIGSPGFPRDDEEIRAVAERVHDRGIHPAGTGRQLAAILAATDRTAALRELDVPTLVVTASLTASCARRAAAPPPRPSRAPASRRSGAWGTTCRGACGRRSWRGSPGSPSGRPRRGRMRSEGSTRAGGRPGWPDGQMGACPTR
jgi:pimeloyl-ACP methyl ester carboxylesterase